MVEQTIFITGATGLLGTETVTQLLPITSSKIYVLVRATSVDDATFRLKSLWWEDKRLVESIGRRVIPVMGDLTQSDLGLSTDDYSMLVQTVTHVVHSAAETGVQKSKHELEQINVEGTRHVVQFAQQMKNLERFVHVSTAYVAGTRRGLIKEEDDLTDQFFTLYERSKAESERIVRASGLPFVVCRPGMVVGHTKTGQTRNFNTVYYVLKLMLQGKMPFLPCKPTQTVNVIPVDEVARALVAVTFQPDAAGKTFHLTPPKAKLPTVRELEQEVRAWAWRELHIRVASPVYVPMPFLRHVARKYNAGFNEKQRTIMSNLTALMPYFLDEHEFDRTNTDRFTGPYTLEWRQFLPNLLAFACRHNFMRLSDKTIFEQASVRRESTHFPVTYYDITSQGMHEISGQQVNAIVVHYVQQLEQMGVHPGDAVAVAGANCVEYIAIDHAIGLVGAISVPIYYTTPQTEIALLLKKSGARWFFVGDTRVATQLQGLDASVQVVKFGPLRERPITQEVTLQGTTRSSRLVHRSLDTSRVSTIRYTSGTTGEPKGVMFSFNQLKWMGEVLTNLLPWRERNSEMRYLSFLPMSHVVEGILAAYAPYCMVCKAKIYYLNDFQQLTQALPRVRPTVFFSVPRFFEKLWEQVEHNRLGQYYLSLSEGWLKRRVGQLLKWGVLRKAGLDKCSQLIVGSAPISDALLLKFRHLGIEIYNAYGQTEAPLITLNRLGDNVISSIGTPLPDTTIRVADDGELIVRGPQVALGYYKMEGNTFSNDELRTGDLGHVDETGHVFISGRKKDLLITSYGKNINCTKVEQRLIDIPGIDQAVLVGDKRPYCTALLWTSGPVANLQQQIDLMNSGLSHPEQVKRWSIIDRPLSISKGELTPNLKVKRSVVIEHFQAEVEQLYA